MEHFVSRINKIFGINKTRSELSEFFCICSTSIALPFLLKLLKQTVEIINNLLNVFSLISIAGFPYYVNRFLPILQRIFRC